MKGLTNYGENRRIDVNSITGVLSGGRQLMGGGGGKKLILANSNCMLLHKKETGWGEGAMLGHRRADGCL